MVKVALAFLVDGLLKVGCPWSRTCDERVVVHVVAVQADLVAADDAELPAALVANTTRIADDSNTAWRLRDDDGCFLPCHYLSGGSVELFFLQRKIQQIKHADS